MIEKPKILTDEQIGKILTKKYGWKVDGWMEEEAKELQRDDTLKKIVEWGDEHCPHHSNSYGPKRKCNKCWEALNQLAGGK